MTYQRTIKNALGVLLGITHDFIRNFEKITFWPLRSKVLDRILNYFRFDFTFNNGLRVLRL